MAVLNLARCTACGAEMTAENLNRLVWNARDAGWVVEVSEQQWGPTFVCPRHFDNPDVTTKLGGPGIKWEAFCYTCDWSQEFWTEDEAKKEKTRHDCDDWMDTQPDIKIMSPEQRREAAEKNETYRIKNAERRVAEKKAADAEANRVLWLESEVERLTAALDKHNSSWKRVFGRLFRRHTPITQEVHVMPNQNGGHRG